MVGNPYHFFHVPHFRLIETITLTCGDLLIVQITLNVLKEDALLTES